MPPDSRLEKLLAALEVAKRVGNTFLAANLLKAIAEERSRVLEP